VLVGSGAMSLAEAWSCRVAVFLSKDGTSVLRCQLATARLPVRRLLS
jgi:hypothetical protein